MLFNLEVIRTSAQGGRKTSMKFKVGVILVILCEIAPVGERDVWPKVAKPRKAVDGSWVWEWLVTFAVIRVDSWTSRENYNKCKI